MIQDFNCHERENKSGRHADSGIRTRRNLNYANSYIIQDTGRTDCGVIVCVCALVR